MRKWLLATSLAINLGLLCFFKYFNFFAQSFADAFTLFGQPVEVSRLNIILPVGISFYTFQTLSYSIDIYRRKISPCLDPVVFFSFVSFFPQLVAGPIERAKNLLPQFKNTRRFSHLAAIDGCKQILWGLLKKMVIADNCATYVDQIFDSGEPFQGSTFLLGAILFAFQIYGDFSGYSDIAIGVSKLFGFRLMKNFAFPYFSRDIAEFWRRWHISLSTWFRDYLYIPLGGSKKGKLTTLRNVIIIFLVSGFWHGSNWTYVFWGGVNALYFIPLLLGNKNRRNLDVVAEKRNYPNILETLFILRTFILVCLGWIFFRSSSISQAFAIISEVISPSLLTFPEIRPRNLILGLFIFIGIEWIGRRNDYAIQNFFLGKDKVFKRWSFYLLISLIMVLFHGRQASFIYFQF